MTILYSTKLKNLFTPSGKPLISFPKKPTPALITEWILETREAYKKQGYWIRRRGLLYLIDFFFIDPSDHPKASRVAERVINALPDEPP